MLLYVLIISFQVVIRTIIDVFVCPLVQGTVELGDDAEYATHPSLTCPLAHALFSILWRNVGEVGRDQLLSVGGRLEDLRRKVSQSAIGGSGSAGKFPIDFR